MRSLSLVLSLVLCTAAQATVNIATTVDKLQYNLASFPTSAAVWMNIKPTGDPGPGITWNVGTMTAANENQVFTLNEQTAPTYGINWAAVETIMTGESITITQTMDASPVIAQASYDWPFYDAPIPPELRPELNNLKFKMLYFITERVRNQNQAYIAGRFEENFLSPYDLADFNHDLVVNAADYITWRKGVGTTYTNNDYNVWRSGFGITINVGSSLEANVVPEPYSIILLLVAPFILRGSKHGK